MTQIGLVEDAGALLFGMFAAIALLWVWIRANKNTSISARTLMKEAEDSITFLFDDETLADATPKARSLLGRQHARHSDWENFLTLVSARFPLLRSQVADLATVGRKLIKPNDSQSGWIDAEYWHGMARITLVQDAVHPDETVDPLTAAAMEHELVTLRSIGEDSPQPIWKHDAEGVLIWANHAYMELSDVVHPVGPAGILPWPPREIFSGTATPAGSAPVIDMIRLDVPDGDCPIWFEITSLKRGTDTIHFAVDATAVVTARDAQRTFVQTLTKTFAELSVGLAIFDADRRLVLFNPALIDLTNLKAEFLIGRPTLFSVLDRLHDHQMMPEPKNYASWRDQMIALESAAEVGDYHEMWSLPNGQTYRVTGKPHPNGAIAFLMEDISDEVSLTRRFRSQIDIGAAVIDNMSDAVAVFSSTGTLVLANNAYRELWGTSSDGAITARDFSDELAIWQGVSAPSSVWVKLQETIVNNLGGSAWDGRVLLDVRVELECRYAPLPDGNHQVTFQAIDQDASDHGPTEPVNFDQSRSLSG